ncbi:hypothetical protein FSP39_011563 [Pinctada imbricata]|uniref:Uncharacterized protein n=1 Tax=Pinctada imbricata TaxID=66713 RepID=A0AA88YNG7_PINIB|nr:hypothetical protein FSP39_011563 [Pinctada imbricata]
MGAAIARSNSRESALSQISRCYNGKSGHRIFTLMRQNMHDIDVWFAIFETENYKKLRDRFIEDKRTENFKEITASNSSEVFLKDGWNLRFFITEGAKNLSHEYHKFIGGSNYNLKLIKIMPTLNKANFAECRVMKKNDGGKHEELLVFPFDIARAVAPSMRKPQGIQNVEPWQQRFPQGISHKVPRGNNRALPSERMHTEYQGWLNDKILRELASNLEEKDIWQLGIQLEIEVDTLTKIEKEFSKDITRGYNIAIVCSSVREDVCVLVSYVCPDYCEQHRRNNDNQVVRPYTNVPYGERMKTIYFKGQATKVKMD